MTIGGLHRLRQFPLKQFVAREPILKDDATVQPTSEAARIAEGMVWSSVWADGGDWVAGPARSLTTLIEDEVYMPPTLLMFAAFVIALFFGLLDFLVQTA